MRRCILVLIALSLTSCSQTSIDGRKLQLDRATEPVFFVRRHANDSHRLDELIASSFRRRGLVAVTEEPERYDYVVTYVDRWYWDMRMYLIDFRVDVRDPENDLLLATARSFQTSLAAMGHRHEEFVEKALVILLDGREALPTPNYSKGGKRPRR